MCLVAWLWLWLWLDGLKMLNDMKGVWRGGIWVVWVVYLGVSPTPRVIVGSLKYLGSLGSLPSSLLRTSSPNRVRPGLKFSIRKYS